MELRFCLFDARSRRNLVINCWVVFMGRLDLLRCVFVLGVRLPSKLACVEVPVLWASLVVLGEIDGV